MRILQLTSDWKWTGPAEPMLVLLRALRARGHDVELACPPPPSEANRSLLEEARARGVEPWSGLARGRAAWARGDRAQVLRLRERLVGRDGRAPFDIVHCWHDRDHVLAARALRRIPDPRTSPPIALVRSLASADRVARWPWNRWLLGPACDGLLCVGGEAVRLNRPLRGGRPIAGSMGAVEPERLVASGEPGVLRAALGVAADAPLVGIVARAQPHRRFDLLLAAMARLVRERPDARLVVIGRGTRIDEVVRAPARRLGLEAHVILAGYRTADYATLLRALDLFCLLVPGSDGTCRALLEAACVGLPLVASRRGAIPEIVRDGVTGILVDETPESLAGAWAALLDDRPRRRALGAAAARDARERFAPERLAATAEALYAESASASPAPTSSR